MEQRPCGRSEAPAGTEGRLDYSSPAAVAGLHAGRERATLTQKKTGWPAQFELTDQTRPSVQDWLSQLGAKRSQHWFTSRFRNRLHLSEHVNMHALSTDGLRVQVSSVPVTALTQCVGRRRPRSTRTGNLRAIQLLLLLGHTKLEGTVRSLGVEMEDALNISEQVEL